MPTQKKYVAVQPFTLNLDDGQKQVDVKRGDCVLFDGLYAQCRGEKGMSRSLVKVVGEWIKPYTGDIKKYSAAMKKQGTLSQSEIPEAPQNPIEPMASRNITGGRILETSDVGSDIEILNRQKTRKQDEGSYEELQNLVEDYENSKEVTEISSDMDDIKKEVTVINSDADIVAQVSDEAFTDADKKNGSSVEIENEKPGKRVVVADDSRVVKETNYTKDKNDDTLSEKHLVVDKEAEGVEVKKVMIPAIHKDEIKAPSNAETTVSEEGGVALETSYDEDVRTDVGSTTQVQTVARKASTKKAVAKKGTAKKGTAKIASKVIDGDASFQDAKVVAKASKIEEVQSDDIITSKVTVGATGETDIGEVEFSSNSEISDGVATFSKSEDTVADVSSFETVTKVESSAVGSNDSDDLDIADLLSDVE